MVVVIEREAIPYARLRVDEPDAGNPPFPEHCHGRA
jgi:hypothetical protein